MRPDYDEDGWPSDPDDRPGPFGDDDLWIPQKGHEDDIPYVCEPLPCQFCPIKCVKKLFSFFRLKK